MTPSRRLVPDHRQPLDQNLPRAGIAHSSFGFCPPHVQSVLVLPPTLGPTAVYTPVDHGEGSNRDTKVFKEGEISTMPVWASFYLEYFQPQGPKVQLDRSPGPARKPDGPML